MAVNFYKLQASGNDFILIDNRRLNLSTAQLKKLAVKNCLRKLGIGADGVLAIEPSVKAAFKMRIFNADGSEAEMCGNGARCTAYWAGFRKPKLKSLKFETKAGVIEAYLAKELVKIKLSDPKKLKFKFPINVLGREIKVNFINTGVPHTVIFVSGLDKIDVEKIGRAVRFNSDFKPAGTNVNFVEAKAAGEIAVRTYERGVESETLACGTGSVASAIIASRLINTKDGSWKVRVLTRGRESLTVYFKNKGDKITDVWLSGRAKLVYSGKLNP